MKRIFAILMACLFMVAVMVVMAAPAFADPPKKNHNKFTPPQGPNAANPCKSGNNHPNCPGPG